MHDCKPIAKRNMIRILFSVAIAAALGAGGFAGCTSQNAADVNEIFPAVEDVRWEVLSDDLEIFGAQDMSVDDRYVYVLGKPVGGEVMIFEKAHPEKAPHIMVRRGQGPGEVVNASGVERGKDPGEFLVFDVETGKMLRANTVADSVYQEAVFALPRNVLSGRRIRCLGQDRYLVQGNDLRTQPLSGRYFIVSGDTIECRYDNYPLDEDLWDLQLLHGHLAVSPDGRNFATGNVFGGLVEFFHINDTSITATGAVDLFPTLVSKQGWVYKPDDNALVGFVSMTADDQSVYGAFYGTPMDSITAGHIAQWDWSGKPVRLFNTDKRIHQIAVDPTDSHTIYGIISDEDKAGEQSIKLAKIVL